MKSIQIGNKLLRIHERESVLDAMIRQGEPVRFSCKKGICKTCRLTLVAGEVPRAATRPFEHLEDGAFLPCLCFPKGDIVIAYPADYEPNEIPAQSDFEFREEQNEDKPLPDPELWERLGQGELLNDILHAFYKEVYEDPQLSPFFKSVTIERAIQKQYNFLYMLMTGEEVFMGARPRNSHHWMVISNELFDYRERMMERHMRSFGLEDRFIDRWKALHEFYRSRIVKDKPWSRIVDGHLLPLSGLGDITAEVGMICDKCSTVIEPGQQAKYHLHTGEVYCLSCSSVEVFS